MQWKEKIIISWSGGKDSALCLYKIRQAAQHDIMCLLTSVSEQYRRISMHGVRVELLDAQADKIGLPLVKMYIPDMPTMEAYEREMSNVLAELKAKGAGAYAFGDIFLEDLREYREHNLSKLNLKGLFPLWKIPTVKLIHEFIDLGFKTITTCVNEKYLDKSFAGRVIDKAFLKDLPDTVDPCGENGEFHTFVFDGPIFSEPVLFEKGEVVYRKYTPASDEDNAAIDSQNNRKDNSGTLIDNGFWYQDLIIQHSGTVENNLLLKG